MAPHLTNTYHQYKAETGLFISWLASTARSNGWRKASSIPSALSSSSRHPIPIGEILPMAKLVAVKGKVASMPPSIARALDRAIFLREAVSSLLQQQHGVVDDKNNRSHSFFVGILKQARQILSGSHQSSLGKDTNSWGQPSSPRLSLSAAFDALKLYEPSQAFLDAPNATFDTAEYDIADDEAGAWEDAHVAFSAMLLDTHALRQAVNRFWAVDFPRGRRFPSALAVATNTAIDLVRKLEEDVASKLDRFGGAAQFLIDHHAAVSGERLDLSSMLAEGDDADGDVYDLAKRTMYEAYYLLDQFRQTCDQQTEMAALYNGTSYGWYNWETADKCYSTRDKFNRDCAGFSELLTETVILIRRLRWDKVQDEFTRGVGLIIAEPSKPIPFWVTFAAQILIDNLQIMGGKFGGYGAYGHVQRTGEWITKRMKSVLEDIEGKPRPVGWPTRKDSALKRLQQEAHYFQTDAIGRWKRKLLPGSARQGSILLKRNAIFAGVWAHHLLTSLHATSIEFANAWGAVSAMHQLDTVVTRRIWIKTRRRLEVKWTDMDIMVSMQDWKNLWVGPVPEPHDMEGFWKQWCFSRGTSASDFASLRGKLPISGTRQPGNPGRGLRQLPPVSMLFRGRLGTDALGHARINLTQKDVKHIIGKGESVEIELTGDLSGASSSACPYKIEIHKQPAASQASRNLKSSDIKVLSPTNLIQILAQKLQGEIGELHFDYTLLHQKCWSDLGYLRRKFDQYFSEANGNKLDYITSEDQLPHLVGLVLRAAAGRAPRLSVERSLRLLDKLLKAKSYTRQKIQQRQQ
ncbi:hypothetical protein QBC40DRAFT_304351 [Triangularia verruculosa]|uniref:DUF6604 domain-containing protein n=1 Tax=Triangularia verruculosa TaxID=2587418 RepID=A0AAN7AXM0_9PEZI|nr:hypothetical protein QBC40DRAFT_304351 [Triangularia verruculosa]